MIAHLSVTALPAQGTSVGRYVRAAVDVIRASGLRFEVHAMGTEIQFAQLDDLFRLVKQIDRKLVRIGAARVTFQLKIDHRRDRPASLEDKVQSALGIRGGKGV